MRSMERGTVPMEGTFVVREVRPASNIRDGSQHGGAFVQRQIRAEIRYYVDPQRAPRVRKSLSHLMNRNIFPHPYNQTLYFNNPDHEVPFTYSIRARRYETGPLRNRFRLNPGEKWIYEFKTTKSVNGQFIRYKRRDEQLALREILTRVGRIRKLGGVSIPHRLGPYCAASYSRSHFLENMRGIRVTVDEDVRFYTFTGELTGRCLGKANHAIVELKIPPKKTNANLASELQHLLHRENAFQGLSKKATTFNLIEDELRRAGEAYSFPRHNTEVEAKVALDSDRQEVFNEIRRDLSRNEIEGFRLSSSYPRVAETSKLQHYVLTSTSDYVRIEPNGHSRSVTVREDVKVMEDPYRLGNVIKKREVTERARPDLLKSPSRFLQRRRKYFVVEKAGEKGEYSVVIDRTTHKGHELYQMEVGKVLNSPSVTIEERSVGNVASIASHIIGEYSLEPTTLTKGEWLMGLPN